jgi:hypothetical protein
MEMPRMNIDAVRSELCLADLVMHTEVSFLQVSWLIANRIYRFLERTRGCVNMQVP